MGAWRLVVLFILVGALGMTISLPTSGVWSAGVRHLETIPADEALDFASDHGRPRSRAGLALILILFPYLLCGTGVAIGTVGPYFISHVAVQYLYPFPRRDSPPTYSAAHTALHKRAQVGRVVLATGVGMAGVVIGLVLF